MSKRLAQSLTLVAALVLSACVGGGEPPGTRFAQVAAQLPPVPPDRARFFFYRDYSLYNSLQRPEIAILQLIYQQKSYEGNARDYEFSPESMHEHWKNGHEDTLSTLKRKEWLKMPPKNIGVVTHDVHRENEGR